MQDGFTSNKGTEIAFLKENKKIQENNLAIIEKNLKLEWGNNYDISNFRNTR